MVDWDPDMLVIILKVHGLNTLIKRQRLPGWIKNV